MHRSPILLTADLLVNHQREVQRMRRSVDRTGDGDLHYVASRRRTASTSTTSSAA